MKVLRDDGCAVGGSSCLECPLPRCVYDLPAAQRQRLFKARGLDYHEDAGA
jgi:hypothetical protein